MSAASTSPSVIFQGAGENLCLRFFSLSIVSVSSCVSHLRTYIQEAPGSLSLRKVGRGHLFLGCVILHGEGVNFSNFLWS